MPVPTHPLPARASLLAAALLALAAAPAAAQRSSAILAATVTDSATGQPLPSARVVVRGTRGRGLTGQDGSVRLAELPAGTYRVQVSLVGYAPREQQAVLEADATTGVLVALPVNPVRLGEVSAEGRTWGQRYLDARGFFERKRSVPGAFITRDQIDRDRPRSLSFLLRRFTRMTVQDDTWSHTARGRNTSTNGAGGYGGVGECQPNYFLNGLLVAGLDISSVNIDTVEGVEVYSGASEVPPDYNKGNRGACGAVLIWTRVH
jgi:hypothetical protein